MFPFPKMERKDQRKTQTHTLCVNGPQVQINTLPHLLAFRRLLQTVAWHSIIIITQCGKFQGRSVLLMFDIMRRLRRSKWVFNTVSFSQPRTISCKQLNTKFSVWEPVMFKYLAFFTLNTCSSLRYFDPSWFLAWITSSKSQRPGVNKPFVFVHCFFVHRLKSLASWRCNNYDHAQIYQILWTFSEFIFLFKNIFVTMFKNNTGYIRSWFEWLCIVLINIWHGQGD